MLDAMTDTQTVDWGVVLKRGKRMQWVDGEGRYRQALGGLWVDARSGLRDLTIRFSERWPIFLIITSVTASSVRWRNI